jgi:hypothetical protein
MADVGIEQINYFCPRKNNLCSIVLYFNGVSDNGKIYRMLECENKLDCVVYAPNEDQYFDWEHCPAYKDYEIAQAINPTSTATGNSTSD